MRIGSYTIPDLRLFPKIYEAVKLIYENYQLEEIEDEDAVARLVGHKSANSGAWLSKKADMRLYGLLEPRTIKLTPLAEKLTYGTEQEKQEAINKAVLNVPLWKELYSKFGVELPESNFWVQLQRITGVTALEAQKYADSIRKAYLEDVKHIKVERKETKVSAKEVSGKTSTETLIPTSIEAQAEIVKGLVIQGAYKIAKDFIDFIESKAKTQKETPEKGN